MIAAVRGILEGIKSDFAIVRVGGISLKIYAPTSTLTSLGPLGSEIELYTHLHLREDNAALYGFASPEDREMFELLLTVPGVGPKAALAALSAISCDDLRSVIARGDVGRLTAVAGIGRKTAGRIVLELKGKIGEGPEAGQPSSEADVDEELVAALVKLGYTTAQAQATLKAIPRDSGLPIEEKILIALRHLAPL